MKVLMITGDKTFKPGHERYDLQRSAVEVLDVVYWGRGSVWPTLPHGPYDVVTSQDPFWRGLFAWYAAKKLRARFNVQVHTDLAAQSFVKHVLAQLVLRHADTIRVVSQKIKDTVAGYGVRVPIGVLPVYIDVSRYRTISRAPDGRTMLWVGRFEIEKNPTLALDVLKDVRERGVDARMIMLGSGSQLRLVEGKAAALSLPVEFPGWQDPTPYYATAGVVLNTSHFEGFSAAMAEALAAGVPVVTMDVSGAREMGATIVPRQDLGKAAAEALTAKTPGQLAVTLPTPEEWAQAWVASL